MRDEMDGRLWVAHHDQYSESTGHALARIGDRIARRFDRLGRLPAQLVAGVLAVGLAGLSLGSTIA